MVDLTNLSKKKFTEEEVEDETSGQTSRQKSTPNRYDDLFGDGDGDF